MKLCYWCNETAIWDVYLRDEGRVPCCCTTRQACKRKQKIKAFEIKNRVDFEFIIQKIFSEHVSPGWLMRNQERFDLVNNACMKCDATHHNDIKIPLEWHHIDSNRKNNNPSNLTYICANCHAIHTRKFEQNYLLGIKTLRSVLEDTPIEKRTTTYNYYCNNKGRFRSSRYIPSDLIDVQYE